jgi:hypothetical protein
MPSATRALLEGCNFTYGNLNQASGAQPDKNSTQLFLSSKFPFTTKPCPYPNSKEEPANAVKINRFMRRISSPISIKKMSLQEAGTIIK